MSDKLDRIARGMSKTEVLYVRCSPEFKENVKLLVINLKKRNLEEALRYVIEEFERYKEMERRAREVKLV